MRTQRDAQWQTEILQEFDGVDAEVAQALLHLRQAPSQTLQQRVDAIAENPRRRQATVRGRRRRFVAWGAVAVVIVLLLFAAFPGLRTAAAQTVDELRQLLGGGIHLGAEGTAKFEPAPPFVVKQPGYLPEGFDPVVQRYQAAPDPASGRAVPQLEQRRVTTDTHAADWPTPNVAPGTAHLLLRYENARDQHITIVERAAQPDDALPAGRSLAVNGQPATIRQVNETRIVTWIEDGTWIELTGTVPEDELLRVAERMRTTQRPTSSGTMDAPYDATPPPLCEGVRPLRGHILGTVEGQEYKGSVTINLFDREVFPETISWGTDVENGREAVLEPALRALQDPETTMRPLPYPSIGHFTYSEEAGCLQPTEVHGYVVMEVWEGQVNVGYGGAGAELTERAIETLERRIQQEQP